ncbi:ABC transporter permease [Eupransor demetentiae]|uniref:Putative hemin transport system permease protein HrtB n=1 Tax=Eupransor demetentiae TaxID=3109584 RepID=A0ABM9N4B4_9LACO|nr:ABC-type antimicrobial peptide transport system [Lactobacillaceae bacterium LMG 33000]
MFLAINEMKKEKLRYGLVIAVITMVSFLIFILSALALGLANENVSSINSWKTQSVVMSKDANGNLSQSMLTADDLKEYGNDADQSKLALTPAIMKKGDTRDSVMFIGLTKNDRIDKSIKLQSGRKAENSSEIVVSSALKQKGFKLGEKVQLGIQNQSFKIVGFAKNASYNMQPVAYGDINQWAGIKGVQNNFVASGVISDKQISAKNSQLKAFNKADYLNNLPGYSAQNSTFILMIAFLIVISVVIVAIFLYILTIQKMENFAVLRAQGIPARYLVLNTLSQTLLIMLSAVVIGMILALVMSMTIPSQVPMYFDFTLISLAGLGLIVMGALGALIPIRLITKIDPVTVIGG